ncbi:IclR family transcriptional regulator [Brevibacterium renqingii]|uniref:IclR family transcriptional regulator n=1 Tax=Brevibacterium renqingii TaxID=2776916 RepID=UPI001ADF6058|nr:IclR family transcriptional regulator [Brevibacterium renqingii]
MAERPTDDRGAQPEQRSVSAGDESARDTALVRGLRILSSVAETGETNAKQLAAELDLPLSTTYRYLKTLREFDLVEEFGGRYLPSSRLSSWSGGNATRSHLLEVGHRFLRRLSARSGRTSVLAVREGRNAVCLRQFAPDEDADIAFRIYEVLPLDRGAGQRVLLAHAPSQIIAEVAAESSHPEEKLLGSLRQIRSSGFAYSQSELRSGANALSCPVIVRGEVLCSLTLAGHSERFGNATATSLKPLLTEAVEELQTALSEVC